MKHIDIQIGKSYRAKVSGKLTTVRVNDIIQQVRERGYRYVCTNLTTNREVIIKSAQKFRCEVQSYGGRDSIMKRLGVEVVAENNIKDNSHSEDEYSPDPLPPMVVDQHGTTGGLSEDVITGLVDPFAEGEATEEGEQGPDPSIGEEYHYSTDSSHSTSGTQYQKSRQSSASRSTHAQNSQTSSKNLDGHTSTTSNESESKESTPSIASDSPKTPSSTTKEVESQPSKEPSKVSVLEHLRSRSKKPLRKEPPPTTNQPPQPSIITAVDATLSSREERRTSDQPPHLMVMARAGTGKTTMLIGGVSLVKGVTPTITPSEQQRLVWDSLEESRGVRSVCMAAFSNAIAAVLKRRVPPGVDAKSLHGMGYGCVLKAMGGLDLPEGNNTVAYFIIEELLGRDIKEIRKDVPMLAEATAELVRLCKVTLSEPSQEVLDYLVDRYDVDLGNREDDVYDLVPRVLTEAKDPCKRGMIDFQDMIWLPVVLDLPMFRYDLLLIDEFQDLGRCQHALAKKAGRRLVMCGDDRQAIYGFTGADTESMGRMFKELGESPLGCREIPLTYTRRCGKAIVREAQKYVQDFHYFPENPEGAVLEGKYPTFKDGMGVMRERKFEETYLSRLTAGDMVVCRVNAPLVNQCFRMLKRGVKAHIQGRKIGEDMISLVERMGAEKVYELVSRVDVWRWEEIRKEQAKKVPSDNRITGIGDKADCIMAFCEDVQTISQVLAKIESLFTDNEKSPGIKFTSIHKAKGLEADRVFFIQPDGASCPHPSAKTNWQQAQELNLIYVAITRAIHELTYVY